MVPALVGGSSCHNSLQLLVKTLCWLHTGLDKGFFCKLQDQATGVLFNQHRWPRDETSAATHPSPGTDGWICTTDTSCTEKYALGMKYLEKATPCSKALKPHQGKKKGKGKQKKKRGKKGSSATTLNLHQGLVPTQLLHLSQTLKRQSCAGRNLQTSSQKPHGDTWKGQNTHCCLNSHKIGHMHPMLPTYYQSPRANTPHNAVRVHTERNK